MDEIRDRVQRLAHESLARGDATGWFEAVYQTAGGNSAEIPWADLAVKTPFGDWLKRNSLQPGRALVVGCGLGDDAVALEERGLRVTAFDIAPTAIDWCRQRFPKSRVDWVVADLLALPEAWRHAFDFVFESYTLQALPETVRQQAISAVASAVAPGGRLLVICRAGDSDQPTSGPPWPLARSELQPLIEAGLRQVTLEDFFDDEEPPVRRFRAEYVR